MAQITIVGNLTDAPRLFTKGKTPRAIFTIAENERPREGEDEGRSHFLQCTAWGTLAENLAGSLGKGTRVVASGRVNTYDKDVEIDGDDVSLTMTSFTVSAIGPDLRWAEADVTRVKPKPRDEDEDEDDEEEEVEKPKRKSKVKSKSKAKASDEDDDVF
ncbi:single-stranded DNA-binding protein [Pseudactinotalea sp. Z1748]|uniref:single-stranded DNA-binding protein n=1 Tax=Pseudactinotalea sp. Z1748 TaxID=3413027 RepID=UPI003C79A6C4